MHLPYAEGEEVASGLVFPEGPVWWNDALHLVEVLGGTLARWAPGEGVRRVAAPGGGPSGTAVGVDGALYLSQNGGVGTPNRTPSGIQRVDLDGSVTMVCTEVGGRAFGAPSDLVTGPDGRLYVTDPGDVIDPHGEVRPGRIFALDPRTGEGEMVVELGPVYPNGIAFDPLGRLVWSESFSRRLATLRPDGRPEVLVELPPTHMPDGMRFDDHGLLYVASPTAGCVMVLAGTELIAELNCGDGVVTSCCFVAGDLYVTAAGASPIGRPEEAEPGTIRRFSRRPRPGEPGPRRG
jgi:gluconolactonase